MSFAERLLLALSRSPEAPDHPSSDDAVNVDNALVPVQRAFGETFLGELQGKRVLDYGCGYGWHAVAYLRRGAAGVTGVDIGEENIAHTRELAGRHGVQDRLATVLGDTHEIDLPADRFDMAVTINTFEHFMNPEAILRVVRPALAPGGRMFITFGPPWLHPYGSHMTHFTRLPWVHLLFRERTVMSVRTRFRDDGAIRYGEVEGGLNQMTVRKFLAMAREADFRVESLRLRGLKGLHPLTRLPGARELFTNRVDCVLARR